MKNLVSFKEVSRSYGKSKALDQISFDLSEKSYAALVGNNGCGKTTTVNILCNIITYDEGEVFFAGRKIEPAYQSYKKMLGITLDKPYFIDEFDVITYWRFVAKYQEVPKSRIEGRIDDLLSLLDLGSEGNKPIKELSSGGQMKVTIGSSLIHNPKMLVLDEPFINLDINTIETLMNLLQSFKGKKTLLLTSHNLDLVAELCDEFLIMDGGKILTNLEKRNFPTLGELKTHVRSYLTRAPDKHDLAWLS